jgi:septum formation protein
VKVPRIMPKILLASTSPYRRDLLARLRVPFEVRSPGVDETALPGEAPRVLARRLAQAKAMAVAQAEPDAIVIGSDQVADVDGEALSKPGGFAAALGQLQRLQGRTVVFHTALAVARDGGRWCRVDSVPTEVRFRRLPDAALERYLHIDTPFDCAGAAKIESLGIALVQSVRSDDPTALIGLPLIAVVDALTACGVEIPAP